MNTILISGTARPDDKSVEYNVNFWGSKEGEQIQLITCFTNLSLDGYSELWKEAKLKAAKYFDDYSFEDGLYTQYLDHLIIIK